MMGRTDQSSLLAVVLLVAFRKSLARAHAYTQRARVQCFELLPFIVVKQTCKCAVALRNASAFVASSRHVSLSCLCAASSDDVDVFLLFFVCVLVCCWYLDAYAWFGVQPTTTASPYFQSSRICVLGALQANICVILTERAV